jgi:hypothetical protein
LEQVLGDWGRDREKDDREREEHSFESHQACGGS